MNRRTLPLETATPEAIAPFGELIGPGMDRPPLPTAFYEGTVRVYPPVAFRSDEDTEITVATIDRRPMQVQWLERHFKHTQTFVPLQGRPFAMILAPKTDTDLPDLDQARAFLFDGAMGFLLHVGTWHEFPFALVDGTNVMVILRGEATRNLMKDTATDGEGHGPDLDKKDMVRRLNTLLTVDVSGLS